jgi:hypothetical protein
VAAFALYIFFVLHGCFSSCLNIWITSIFLILP